MIKLSEYGFGGANSYFLTIPKLPKDSQGNSTLDIKPLLTFKEKLDKITLE
jgi:hypothetical protein